MDTYTDLTSKYVGDQTFKARIDGLKKQANDIVEIKQQLAQIIEESVKDNQHRNTEIQILQEAIDNKTTELDTATETFDESNQKYGSATARYKYLFAVRAAGEQINKVADASNKLDPLITQAKNQLTYVHNSLEKISERWTSINTADLQTICTELDTFPDFD